MLLTVISALLDWDGLEGSPGVENGNSVQDRLENSTGQRNRMPLFRDALPWTLGLACQSTLFA